MKRLGLFCLAVVMAFSMAGWGARGSASAEEVAQSSIQGTWNWVLKEKTDSPDPATGTVDFKQNANVLTGMFTVGNSGAYALNGTFDGSEVKFTVAIGEATITFHGLINSVGEIMAGAKASGGQKWTWRATRL